MSFNEKVKESLRVSGELVGGAREDTHGSIPENYTRAAKLWSAHLGMELSATDVCILQGLLKVARMSGGTFNPDDYHDAQSYFAMAHALGPERPTEYTIHGETLANDPGIPLGEFMTMDFSQKAGVEPELLRAALKEIVHGKPLSTARVTEALTPKPRTDGIPNGLLACPKCLAPDNIPCGHKGRLPIRETVSVPEPTYRVEEALKHHLVEQGVKAEHGKREGWLFRGQEVHTAICTFATQTRFRGPGQHRSAILIREDPYQVSVLTEAALVDEGDTYAPLLEQVRKRTIFG